MIRACAKLNLYLHVLGKRADGYHELESLVVFTELADGIAVAAGDGLSLVVEGDFAAAAGDSENNLVMRAARALQAHTNVAAGAQITVTKNIPVGAGLGGGSADAAATLRVLNKFWDLHLGDDVLVAIAVTLGADVAMCLQSRPLIARGIGEVVAPLSHALPPMWAVLVYPAVALLSGEVYGALDIALTGALMGASGKGQLFNDFIEWLATQTRNDLQEPAMQLSPLVAQVLRAMETALPSPALVRMTGSGSCCFALFAEQAAAERYAHVLSAEYPHWWVRVTAILR